jgi:hypothetical protein
MSPSLNPLIESNPRNKKPTPLAPPLRRATFTALSAEQLLGRLTPDSSISRHTYMSSRHSGSLAALSDEETDTEDWPTKIPPPHTIESESLFPGHLSSLRICLRTEIYSPHRSDATSSYDQAYSRIALIDVLDCPSLNHESNRIQWFAPTDGQREVDNRLYYPVQLSLHTIGGTVEIEDEFSYLGDGRFWCGGFIVVYSSRRVAGDDISMIAATFREECAWLKFIEADVFQVERWIGLSQENGEQREDKVGQWADEDEKAVKRELPPEMFI